MVKDPLPNKGARISTHVTLPGRYLVLLPTVRHFGVSRRIEDEAERERLLAILAAAPGDRRRADRAHRRARARGRRSSRATSPISPACGRRSASAPARSRPPPSSTRTSTSPCGSCATCCARTSPSSGWTARRPTSASSSSSTRCSRRWSPRSSSSASRRPTLFEQFGIEEQIEAALKSKVWLKSGGYIVINPTEALVAIDVNTGRFVGPEQPRGHGAADQPRGGAGDRAPDPPARPRRDHRHRPHRHGRAGAPRAGLRQPGERDQEGPRQDQGAQHLRVRPGRDHPQAQPRQPRAPAHPALPLLRRPRAHQVGGHHLPQPAQGAAPPARTDRPARSCCCASTRRSRAPCSRRSGRSSTSWSARSGCTSCSRAIPSCTTSASTSWRSDDPDRALLDPRLDRRAGGGPPPRRPRGSGRAR